MHNQLEVIYARLGKLEYCSMPDTVIFQKYIALNTMLYHFLVPYVYCVCYVAGMLF